MFQRSKSFAGEFRGEVLAAMQPTKIKITRYRAKGFKVEVKVKRAKWQQFLSY